MKVAQACMAEDLRTIQKALGLVSCCCRCPQEGTGPSPPSMPLPAALGVTQHEGPLGGRVRGKGVPEGHVGAQPTPAAAPHPSPARAVLGRVGTGTTACGTGCW